MSDKIPNTVILRLNDNEREGIVQLKNQMNESTARRAVMRAVLGHSELVERLAEEKRKNQDLESVIGNLRRMIQTHFLNKDEMRLAVFPEPAVEVIGGEQRDQPANIDNWGENNE